MEKLGWFDRMLAAPIGAALISAAGLLSSVWLTVAGTDIAKGAGGLHHSKAGLAFIACAVFAVYGFFRRQRITDTQRENAQGRLESSQSRMQETAEDLARLLKTMPPRTYLKEAGVLVEKCMQLCDTAEVTRDSILDSVTVVLGGIATLAGQFDGSSADTRFAANIMVFVSGEDAIPWKEHQQFTGDTKTLDGLRGLLVLPREFSATAAGEIDQSVPEFALPVPNVLGADKATGGIGWRILPGGPMAFVHQGFEYFRDTSELSTWCRTHGDFPDHVIQQISGYFSKHRDQILGFLSVPLHEPTTFFQESGMRNAVAVLNVHWNRAAILATPEAAEIFAESVYPLRVLLAQQLMKLCRVHGPPKPTPTAPHTEGGSA